MRSFSPWPVLILAAGLGTRLRPLSDFRAKAAVPLAGTPLIAREIEALAHLGVRRVVINLHHLPHTITRIVGDGSQWGVDVRYSWEPVVLGSAGGPRKALELLDADRFLIINADTVTSCDVRRVAASHLHTGAKVTLAVVPGDVERYGGVVGNEQGIVSGFVRAGAKLPPDQTAWHFIGVQAVDARVFADVPVGTPYETVRHLYPKLLAEQPGAIRTVFDDRITFMDVGTPSDYWATSMMVATMEGRALGAGANCVIDPTARLKQSVLWDRVTVGANAHLERCIVADDVTVPPDSHYSGKVLVNRAGQLEVSAM